MSHSYINKHRCGRRFFNYLIGKYLLPTYRPGGDWLCGRGGWQCGGGEFLRSELVVSDEAICCQTEIWKELDQELVPLWEHGPARIPEWIERDSQGAWFSQKIKSEFRDHLRWGAVSAVFANPLGVVDFCPVENGDVVVAAVVVSFHIKLLKLYFNNLQQKTHHKENPLSLYQRL